MQLSVNPNHMLTPNFKAYEFICKCGCSKLFIHPRVVECLQEIRELCGKPIIVTSGCRCREHPIEAAKILRGRKPGRHCNDETESTAADWTIPGLTLVDMFRLAILSEPFHEGGIGIYPNENFIHTDISHPVWRKHTARWSYFRDFATGRRVESSMVEGWKCYNRLTGIAVPKDILRESQR